MTSTRSPKPTDARVLVAALVIGSLTACATDPRAETEDDLSRSAEFTSQEAFCDSAQHFRLGEAETLSSRQRLHYLEAMQQTVKGPTDLQTSLDAVLHTFEHRAVDEEGKLAGVRVGEYIEANCPGVNIGGARYDGSH